MLEPWSFLAGLVVGLVVGFIGHRALLRLTARTRGSAMPPTQPPKSTRVRRKPRRQPRPLPDWYIRTAPSIMLALIVLVGGALVGILYGMQTDARQDRQSLANQGEVLRCIDSWGQAVSGALPPVREATIRKDVASADARAAWQAWREANNDFTVLMQQALRTGGDAAQAERLRTRARDILATIVRTNRQVARAEAVVDLRDRQLAKARRDNPYPEAPSLFCAKEDGL